MVEMARVARIATACGTHTGTKTVTPDCFYCYAIALFDSVYQKNKTPPRWGGFLFLVEMARVELASENLFPKLSTSIVYLLEFPQLNAGKQALSFGSPLIRDKVQGYPLFTCTAKRRSYPSRGTPGRNGS